MKKAMKDKLKNRCSKLTFLRSTRLLIGFYGTVQSVGLLRP